ncbi:acyl carrier protein [Methyloraptor flagellatus]|jgi:acyl carrier protein|uniref:Acyl carrier protein n=1 Tax=Methyloraptor flagellatus TaxID=3162530 RepID=A0AAU7XI96_9HYPH
MSETTAYDSVDAIVAKLIDMLRTTTKQSGEGWSAATTLQEAGIDSFDVVEYIFEIEDTFGVEVDFNANTTEDRPHTIGDFATMIAKKRHLAVA